MKLCPNDPEVLKIIRKICKRYRGYTFPGYDSDDIEQECFLLALQALEKYDGVSPLENFLAVCVKFRLINLKRKKFMIEKQLNSTSQTKYLLAYAIDIGHIVEEEESSMQYNEDLPDRLDYKDLLEMIDKVLPVEYRMDFLRMVAGLKVSKSRKERIRKIIIDLL